MSTDLLSRILENELLTEDLVEISRGDISELIDNHKNTMIWCSRRINMKELCQRYLEITRDILISLASIRIIKSLKKKDTLKKDPFIEIVLKLRDLYMRFLYDTPLDPFERIPIKMLADVKIGDRVYLEKRRYLIPYDEALKLLISGLAELAKI
ncbi:MAG: hypothetical protein ACP5I7_04150 [Sulfolobales archaeon]